MRSTNRLNRRGISNVVVIVIIIIIAVAVAVAVWVSGRVGAPAKSSTKSSTPAKSSTLQLQSVSLTGVSSGTSATLTLVVSNPSSSNIGIVSLTLGGLACDFSNPIPEVLAGAQGEPIVITLTISNGDFTGASFNGVSAICIGSQPAQVGVQYHGAIITTSGTYQFTVTASS
jgi:hypothetical protein